LVNCGAVAAIYAGLIAAEVDRVLAVEACEAILAETGGLLVGLIFVADA